MAVETRRGCGFRKVGNLYLVADGGGAPCDRLPFLLEACPCCGGGIKPARGWTWISPVGLFLDNHIGRIGTETLIGDADFSTHDGFLPCSCPGKCPVCHVREQFPQGIRAGLLWIGEQHYPRPQDFIAEAAAHGISRRIATLPKDFRVGTTWIFLAHRKCGHGPKPCPDCEGSGLPQRDLALNGAIACPRCKGSGTHEVKFHGVFMAYWPQRVERVVKQSEYDHFKSLFALNVRAVLDGGKWYHLVTAEDHVFWRLKRDTDRGITLVPVPDNDPDHASRNGQEDD